MKKNESEPDIHKLLLKGYRKGVKRAIEIASRANTSLIIEENGKIMTIKPKYKYIRVLTKGSKKKILTSKQKKLFAE